MKRDEMIPANLTYIQAIARGPLPDRPGAWENFAEQVDRAAEELRECRQAEAERDRYKEALEKISANFDLRPADTTPHEADTP